MIVHPESTRIGWIGTGVMGRSMCSHLLKAGYKTSVYNRTPAKLNDLISLGAVACSSPEDVAKKSDIVFSMVGYPSDVEEVILGQRGVLTGLVAGGVIVDMTTSRPGLAAKIAGEALRKGVVALDAPVSGGDVGAREARLSIMVGGTVETFVALTPLWKLMGATYVFQGPPGSGQHTKMVNQILIASAMVGLCEALLYAKHNGLNPELVLQSVSSGAAGSWSLSNLTPRILKADYAPGFFVDHIVKDLAIAIEEAEKVGLELPGLSNAKKAYEYLQAMGHGKSGTQSLILGMSKQNSKDW
jgi:3-hydroxyisobutyrate dehydrogenase